MSKGRNILTERIKANTLVELLLTLVISGIIFLLVFDGVGIIKKISYTVNKRIATSQTVLSNHQLMEQLMENADSVIKRSNRLLFYNKGIATDSVTMGESFFILDSQGRTDTLFTGYIDYRISLVLDTGQIDSLNVNYVVNAKDTIWLEYGLPTNRFAYLNNSGNNEDSQ